MRVKSDCSHQGTHTNSNETTTDDGSCSRPSENKPELDERTSQLENMDNKNAALFNFMNPIAKSLLSVRV